MWWYKKNYPEWEWEVVDWKNNRIIRIVAVDNGRVCFYDTNLKTILSKPIPVITYPLVYLLYYRMHIFHLQERIKHYQMKYDFYYLVIEK